MQRCSRFTSSQQLMTTLVCCIQYHMYTVVPAIACPILSLQVAHIWVQALHACMHTCISLASQTIVACKSQYACKLSSLKSLGEGAGNYIL